MVAGAAVAVLAMAGCGAGDQVSGIASQAASAAASGVKDQASQAVDAMTGPVCDGLDQAAQSLPSLAESKATTVGEAKKQLAAAKSDLQQATEDATGPSAALLSGVTTALDGLSQSLNSLKDDAAVPESFSGALDGVESSITAAQDSLGC